MDDASEAGAGPTDAGQFSPRPLPPGPVQAPMIRRGSSDDPDPTRLMPAADIPTAARAPSPTDSRRPALRTRARPAAPRRPLSGAEPPTQRLPARPPGGGRGEGFRRRAVLGLGVAGALVTVVVVLWVLDGQATKGHVARNVVLLDRDIGGMDRPEVVAAVSVLTARYESADVEVKAPDGGFKAGAAELGLAVDRDATVDAALDVGTGGFVVSRIWNWATGFVGSRKAPVLLTVDENAVRKLVAERDPKREPPVEPNIEVKDGHIVAVDGRPGRGIDPATVVLALRSDAGRRFPLAVSVPRREVRPRYGLADAQRVAAEAETLALDQLPVVIGGVGATVPAATVRTWLRGIPSDAGLRLGIDADGAAEDLAALFPDAGKAPVDAGATIIGGGVVITPAQTGTACCAPEATKAIEDALRNRRPGDPPVNLPLRIIPPSRDEDAVRKMGITEVVGSFTTNHPAGAPRVTNIHRMADIVEGAIIEPGGTFSLNGYVGERTIEKGFVEAPVIDGNYLFSKDVGGGVSQFSTTLFNAAFFAGLDIPTYGMHGIYIARYPYGREATLDYPSLDLKVRNPTPHGVLIWPTYSDTSITVTLYSTKTVEGAQTNQTKEDVPTTQVKKTTPPTTPDGAPAEAPPPTEPPAAKAYVCTRVVTERTRTYTDGRTEVDKFYALYAPEEGVVCPR